MLSQFTTSRGMIGTADETAVRARKVTELAEALEDVWASSAAKAIPGELERLAKEAGVRYGECEMHAEQILMARQKIADRTYHLRVAADDIREQAEIIRHHTESLGRARRAALRERQPI